MEEVRQAGRFVLELRGMVAEFVEPELDLVSTSRAYFRLSIDVTHGIDFDADRRTVQRCRTKDSCSPAGERIENNLPGTGVRPNDVVRERHWEHGVVRANASPSTRGILVGSLPRYHRSRPSHQGVRELFEHLGAQVKRDGRLRVRGNDRRERVRVTAGDELVEKCADGGKGRVERDVV